MTHIPRAERLDDMEIRLVTVYLKSGAVVTFPGQYVEYRGEPRFAALAPLQIPFTDMSAVALVLTEPWTGEN